MKKLELTDNQVQLLLKAQDERIKELEKKVECHLSDCDFEMRSKWAFREFIESLGQAKMVECVEFIYKNYGVCDFTKDTLEYWHDEKLDISEIAEGSKQFESWLPEEKI